MYKWIASKGIGSKVFFSKEFLSKGVVMASQIEL